MPDPARTGAKSVELARGAPGPLRAGAELLSRAVLVSLVSWLSLAACAAVASVLVADAVGSERLLDVAVRRHLVAREQVLLLVPAALPGLFLLLASIVPAASVRRAAAVAATALSAFLFLVYVVAWGTFQFVGRFPDVRALIMFASDSVQIVEHALHIDASSVARSVAGSVAAATAWSFLTLRLLAAPARLRLLCGLLAVAAVAASVGAARKAPAVLGLAGNRVVDPEAGVDMLLADFLAEAEGTRTGPLLRVRASLHETAREPTRAEGRAALARCSMQPLVSLAEWKARVDPARARRLNVILIEVESLRNDQLAAFGGTRTVMPTLDALAREGVAFTRHYTLSSHSNYADIPPLSSHYPLRSPWYHIYPEDPPYPRVLVYDLLHELGYRTAIVSSQNENWGGMANYLSTPGLDDLLHSANFDGDTYVPGGDTGFHKFAATHKKSGKVDDGATVGRAIAWLERLEAGRPFFLYLNLQNSHVPYETPASFEAPFPRPDPSLRIFFNHIPPARVAEVKNAYSNSLAYADAQIARLFGHLRKTGRWDDTVLVVGGDNGEAFLEHGFAGHANALYDEVVHTPVVLRAPGLAPATDSRLAATLDIPPTILDVLGLPPHPGWQGRSLLGPPPPPGREVFLVAQTPLSHQYAVVRGRHKLIEDQRKGEAFLYDLVADPREANNLVEWQASTADELSERLDLWVTAQLAYYGDPALFCCFYPPVLPE